MSVNRTGVGIGVVLIAVAGIGALIGKPETFSGGPVPANIPAQPQQEAVEQAVVEPEDTTIMSQAGEEAATDALSDTSSDTLGLDQAESVEAPEQEEMASDEIAPEGAIAEDATPEDMTPEVETSENTTEPSDQTQDEQIQDAPVEDAQVIEPQEQPAEPESDDAPVDAVEDAEPTETPLPDAEEEEVQETIITTPEVSTSRIDADGAVLMAGRADAGAVIEFLLDGKVVASTVADAGGNFVGLFDIGPSTQARTLSTRSQVGGQISDLGADFIVVPQVRVAETSASEEPSAPEEPTENLQEEQVAQTATVEEAPQAETASDDGTDVQTAELTDQGEVAQTSSEDATSPAEEVADTVAQVTEEEEPQVADVQVEAQAQDTDAAQAAPTAQAVLSSDAEGVKVVQPAATDTAPQEIALDAISYDDVGAVAISGRGNPSEFVQVYLDNAIVSSTEIGVTGQWEVVLNDVPPGVYNLRLDQVNANSKVTSRLVTPFKREEPEKLVAQVEALTEPARINVVTVQPGSTLWAIARERYGEGILYVTVFNANRDKIKDPDLIYPGQVFALPDQEAPQE